MIADRPLVTTDYSVDEVLALNGWAREAEAEIRRLQAFKEYVHQRLDQMGIPADPEPERTAETGCRIGSRLNCVQDRYTTMGDAARTINSIVGGKELARMPADVARILVYVKRMIQDADAKTSRAV